MWFHPEADSLISLHFHLPGGSGSVFPASVDLHIQGMPELRKALMASFSMENPQSGNINCKTSGSFPFPSRRMCGSLELSRLICYLSTFKNQHKFHAGLENPSPWHTGFIFTRGFSNWINFIWIVVTGRKHFATVPKKIITEQGCFQKSGLNSVNKTEKLTLLEFWVLFERSVPAEI